MIAAQPPWPTRDQVITSLGRTPDRGELRPYWPSVLIRLRQAAEQHTALRNACDLLTRERDALTGEPAGADPVDTRPSGSMAIHNTISRIGQLETEALHRYACLAQAALEQLATEQDSTSWHELPGETPKRSPLTGETFPPERRIPDALAEAPEVDLIRRAKRAFATVDQAIEEYQEAFGCNETCHEDPDGCGGGPHVADHEIEYESELLADMDRSEEYLADYADAIAWTLTHELRDRLLTAPAGPEGSS